MNCVVQLKLYIDFPITSKQFTETTDKVMLAESEGMLQRIVDEYDRICKRRKLKVNAGKSKVMVFKIPREQTINFAKPYRVGSEAILGCKIWLGKEKTEANEFKHLGQSYVNMGTWKER